MIEAVEIINFQPHENTVLEFAPGVNVIKGQSRSGKSSIIRSLEWLFFNRPRGEGFKSHFAMKQDPVSVSCEFNDGQWIVRTKDRAINGYLSEDHTLKAFKTDVPQEITDISRIDRVNFQKQGDPYFLIGETPGQAGKKLNEFIGLTIIDKVRDAINHNIRVWNTKLNITEESLEKTNKNLLNYDHLKPAEKLVNQIDKSNRSLAERSMEIEVLEEITEGLLAYQSDLDEAESKLKIETDFTLITTQFLNSKDFNLKYEAIESVVVSIYSINESIQRARIVLGTEKDFQSIKSFQNKLAETLVKRRSISEACSGVRYMKRTLKTGRISLENNLKRQSELQKQLEYCNVCGSLRIHWRREIINE